MAKHRKMDLSLAVDIGNTNTVIGMFENGSIRRRWRLATRKDTTVDEITWWLHGLMRSDEERARVNAIAIASVVPVLDDSWVRALAGEFNTSPQVLDYSNCLGLELDYEIPRQIGADRLANVLGAYALGHKQGVVIDFGTATTYDIFGDYGYWGGIICPGIHTSLRSLAQSAAKLSEVELKWTQTAIGKTTDDALRIGMLMGTLGQVEYLLKAIISEKKMQKPSIIATGGLAPLLGERTKIIRTIEPDLTLIGIHYLLVGKAKSNSKSNSKLKSNSNSKSRSGQK